MRERKRHEPTEVPTPNLTPMIDVVFNLIIFFMVITDMTQKDLEYLVVPDATQCDVETPPADLIVVNVVDPDAPHMQLRASDGSYDPTRPPVFLQGRQIADLEDLRRRLYRMADPNRWPDREAPEVQPGLHPSRRPLRIRCDQSQIFGWVQAIMQILGPRPGVEGPDAYRGCPLIRRVEIAVEKPEDR